MALRSSDQAINLANLHRIMESSDRPPWMLMNDEAHLFIYEMIVIEIDVSAFQKEWA